MTVGQVCVSVVGQSGQSNGGGQVSGVGVTTSVGQVTF